MDKRYVSIVNHSRVTGIIGEIIITKGKNNIQANTVCFKGTISRDFNPLDGHSIQYDDESASTSDCRLEGPVGQYQNINGTFLRRIPLVNFVADAVGRVACMTSNNDISIYHLRY